jgi:hypothetical protein
MTNEEFRRISYQWLMRRSVDARTGQNGPNVGGRT